MTNFLKLKIRNWLWPQADVCLPLVVLKSLYYQLHGKSIIADHRTMIRGLKNIEIKGRLVIGQMGGILHCKDWTSLNIEGKLTVRGHVHLGKGSRVHVCKGGELILEECHLTGMTIIIVKKSIKIGKGCAIAWNTEFVDWNSHKIEYEGRRERDTSIVIGEHVWIGSGAKILPGVTIEKGSVVSANAVVTKSFPENVLIAGNPARVVRENVSWGNYE